MAGGVDGALTVFHYGISCGGGDVAGGFRGVKRRDGVSSGIKSSWRFCRHWFHGFGVVFFFFFLVWLTDETFELESHYSRLTLCGTGQVDPIWQACRTKQKRMFCYCTDIIFLLVLYSRIWNRFFFFFMGFPW